MICVAFTLLEAVHLWKAWHDACDTCVTSSALWVVAEWSKINTENLTTFHFKTGVIGATGVEATSKRSQNLRTGHTIILAY